MTKKPIGVLDHPIEVRDYSGSILAPRSVEEARLLFAKDFARQVCERLIALFDHYKIPDLDGPEKKNWPALALHLAMDKHPAFRVVSASRRKRGRSRGRRHPETLMQLLVDVESVKAKRSDKAALTTLTTNRKFAARWGGKNVDTLIEDLRAARDPEQNLFLAVVDHIRPEFREMVLAPNFSSHGTSPVMENERLNIRGSICSPILA